MDNRKGPQGRPGEAAKARQQRREAFAREMARSVLGRHYWSEASQRELEAARKRKDKPK